MNYRKIARVVCLILLLSLIIYWIYIRYIENIKIPPKISASTTKIKHTGKPVWMCWFQGEEDFKKNKQYICLKGWRTLNPDWDVILLTRKNIDDYIPGLTSKLFNNNHTFAAKSDLLRLYFLEKYGGVWVDASVVPTRSLRNYYDIIVNKTGFFTYRFIPRSTNGNREIISWFLVVNKPNHYLIKSWKDKFEQSFNSVNKFSDTNYFTLHSDLSKLYDEDPKIKNIINNMEQISESIPHGPLEDPSLKKITSYMHKRPKDFLNNNNLIRKYEKAINYYKEL